MQPLTPIHTAHLFGPLHRELMSLLRGLAPEDWLRPTVAGAWRVRDVAAHLLDVDLRSLSVNRDGHVLPPDRPISGHRDLVGWINHLNATGVGTSGRMSDRVIMDLLDVTGVWMADMVEGLPPEGLAVFAVSWAGETESAHWMDIGREYTERWHHQAQIRDALGAPRLLARRWLEPLMDLSVRVLPVTYASVEADQDTAVVLEVLLPELAADGSALTWTVARNADGWRVWRGAPDPGIDPAARVRLAADDAWRLFYNALDGSEARRRVRIEGALALAEPLLMARSVMV